MSVAAKLKLGSCVINFNKINLPVCAFGAGAAHAAVLGLVLPIMITLPAPAERAPRIVAIPVEVRTEAPEPVAEGDAEDTEQQPVDAPGSADVTAALATPTAAEEVNAVAEAAPSEEALAPEPEPDAGAPLSAVANVDAEQVPDAVPVPLRRPAPSKAVDKREPANAIKPAPKAKEQATAYRPRSRVPPKPANKGFLGGRTATSMPEYPFQAGP